VTSKHSDHVQGATRQIAKHLYEIRDRRFFEAFDDWLTASVAAFAHDEDAYIAIIRKYGPRIQGKPHAADHFSYALGELMRAMQHEPADYLGQIYEAESITNKYQGQFFTPEPLCELMADITMPDGIADDQGVSDPACGSGRMLIAAIRRNRFANFMGVDTDLTSVNMAAINILFRNANAYVIHGNSLSLKAIGGYQIRRTWSGGELRRLSKEHAQQILEAAPKASLAAQQCQQHLDAPQRIPSLQVIDQSAVAQIEKAEANFHTNKKGQYDLGF